VGSSQADRGAVKVARFLHGIAQLTTDAQEIRVVTVNGGPGLGIFEGDRLTTAVVLTVVDELISRIDFIRARAKLATAQPRSGQT
jgi:RNA polymerase sigma-70 factor (ECF subfamily)